MADTLYETGMQGFALGLDSGGRQAAQTNLISAQAQEAQMKVQAGMDEAKTRMGARAAQRQAESIHTELKVKDTQSRIKMFDYALEQTTDPEVRDSLLSQKVTLQTEDNKNVLDGYKVKAAQKEEDWGQLEGVMYNPTPEGIAGIKEMAKTQKNPHLAGLAGVLEGTVPVPGTKKRWQDLDANERQLAQAEITRMFGGDKTEAQASHIMAEKARADKLVLEAQRIADRAIYEAQLAAAKREGQDSKATRQRLDRETLILKYKQELNDLEEKLPTVTVEEPGMLYGTNKVQVPNPRIKVLEDNITKLEQGSILDAVKPVSTGEDKVTAKDGKVYARPVGMSDADWEEYKVQVGK